MAENFFVRPSPCGNCPFSGSGPGRELAASLRPGRREDIAKSLLKDEPFVCHKENLDEDRSSAPRHCAGASVLCDREGRPNQMMRTAERLGDLLPDVGLESVPFKSFAEWLGYSDG